MRILHVVPSFGLGGMEKIICLLINNTSRRHNHSILALDRCILASNWINDRTIRFVDFKNSDQRMECFRTLYQTIADNKPDLLMTYNWGAIDAIWLGRLTGIRRIIHNEHGFNVDEGRETLLQRDAIRFLLYRLASRVIVVSKELERLLKRRYRIEKDRLVRVPNGVDVSYYSPNHDDRNSMRAKLGFDNKSIVVGFSGRLDPIKNFDLMINIFCSCAREDARLKLLIVGDGPERPRVEKMCCDAGVQDRVVFAGQQESVLSYLRAMDMFLLTSIREQMPMTVLEAMAVGIPVLATTVGEIPDIVDHGSNGFVLHSKAPIGEFMTSLNMLVCAKRRAVMGNAARRKIVTSFQQKDMIRQYSTIIEG